MTVTSKRIRFGLVCTVSLVGLFASLERSFSVHTFSGNDEAQHWDNVSKYVKGQIPRYEGTIDPSIAEAVRCFDIDPVDDRPSQIRLGAGECVTEPKYLGVLSVGPYEAGQPPLYYAVVSLAHRLFTQGDVSGLPYSGRFVNSLAFFLAIGILGWVFVHVGRPLGEQTDHWPGVSWAVCIGCIGAPLTLFISPALIEASGTASNDMLAILASTVCIAAFAIAGIKNPGIATSVAAGGVVGVMLALTKLTTIVVVAILATYIAIDSVPNCRSRIANDKAHGRLVVSDSRRFAMSVVLAWIITTLGWASLIDRLTSAPISSLPVFNLWREPLSASLARVVGGTRVLSLRGAFGANNDSIAFKGARLLALVVLGLLVVSVVRLTFGRTDFTSRAQSIALGFWIAAPALAIITYLGTGKAHADARLMLPAMPWILLLLSAGAWSSIRSRRSMAVMVIIALAVMAISATSTMAYLAPFFGLSS